MRAVVIGSGIAGPAAALALQEVGVSSVVLEAHPRPSGDAGSYLAVSPNGLSALAVLSVLDAVKGVGQPTAGSVILGATGRVLGRPSFGRPLDDGTPALTLKRSRLAAVLGDTAAGRGVELRYDARVASLRRTACGTVVTLASGEELEADLVVGADGVHSVVRRHLDPLAPAARYVGLTNFGGVARTPDLAATLEPGAWTFVFGRRAFSGLVPTPDGDVIWFVNLPRAAITPDERARTSQDQWREVLVEALAGDAGCAAEAVGRGEFELAADNTHDLGHVPVWHDGSAVVIGDAAHAPAPSSGQGASMALEDAVALAVAVRDAATLPQALASYEAARRPRAERVVAVGARSSSAKLPGRLSRPVVEAVMRVVLRTVASDARQQWMSGYRVSWEAPEPAGLVARDRRVENPVMGKPYSVTRTATIAAPAERIRGLLSDFHEWTAWSPWEDLDPGMQRTFSGAERGVGARYAWEGNRKAGKGTMAITKDEPQLVGVDLHFDKPFPADSTIDFVLIPAGAGSTTVEWRLDGELSPMMRVFALVKSMDSLVGPDFERGLGRLKRVAESPSG